MILNIHRAGICSYRDMAIVGGPSRPDPSLIAAGCRSHIFARPTLGGGPSRPDPKFIAARMPLPQFRTPDLVKAVLVIF